ncbi:MAG: arginine--tRNA ligase [Candidatus Margulisiibacteriota bacterium]
MLKKAIGSLLDSITIDLGLTDKTGFKLDISPRKELGDYASNLPIVAARRLSRNPLELAKEIADKITAQDNQHLFSRIEAVKPGFINFFLSDNYIQKNILTILEFDQDWGRMSNIECRISKILLEFVSANPTGPLHVGHGRWAVIGDIIARLLKAAGNQVETEFYVNNIGNQVEKFEASVLARREGREIPEDGYGGSYIKDVQGDTREQMLACVIGEQKKTLENISVRFDRWFYESQLHDKKEIDKAIEILKQKGLTYEKEGALWFSATQFGDDKDRVLKREDGRPTYFAADIAYHLDKYERGFDKMINIWGTDHHGYVKRIEQAIKALGLDEKKLEVIIGQLVALYRGAELVRMSKRTGEMVTLQEVVDEIGADATRFFFAATDVNSHLNFDLELAKKKSNDNPVYYVQYAHARICSILKKSTEPGTQNIDLTSLTHPAERELMLKLLSWPDMVEMAAKSRHPHRITEYGKELATVFHHFYEKCRVLGDPARETLALATRITLRNVLNLLGISAPEVM